MVTVPKIDLETFLNRFAVRPSKSYAIFLGAGASVQAGIPTGAQLTWEFKNNVYCNHHKIDESKYVDLGAADKRKAIQNYLDTAKILPSPGESEYSYYFERCYPSPVDRKFFMINRVRDIAPSFGHRCLGQMIIGGKIDQVFTTNFDELIEAGIKALNPGFGFVTISSELGGSVANIGSTFPRVIKLHGDYRYDELQNTTAELRAIDTQLLSVLKEVSATHGMIVAGYSGSDKSVLDALKAALKAENAFPHGLVWCHRPGVTPNDEVLSLLEEANQKNHHSGLLEIENFDELAFALYGRAGASSESINKDAVELQRKNRVFTIGASDSFLQPFIMNALRVSSFPTTAYQVNASEARWSDLKEPARANDVIFSLSKGTLYMWGDENKVIAFLNSVGINSSAVLGDISKSSISKENSFYVGMIYDGLLKAFESTGFIRFRRHGVYDPTKKLKLQNYDAFEALEFQLNFAEGDLWLNLFPNVFVDSDDDGLGPIINKYQSERWNPKFGVAVREWRDKIASILKTDFNLGGQFKLKVDPPFAFAGQKSSENTKFFTRMTKFDEPVIEFSHSTTSKASAHPLRGLQKFGPFQNSYLGRSSAIRLAIIAPRSDFVRVRMHLESLNNALQMNSEREIYLPSFPGFGKVFGHPLDIPSGPTGARVVLIDNKEVETKTYVEFYELLKRSIDKLESEKANFEVLVIYIPAEWKNFRECKTEEVYFDLHDSAKIYAARLGIKVQFVEQKSIENPNQVRVRWWLSQGLYTKGIGIPWKMVPTAPNTAYIGLGYSLRSGTTLMAASQLFDETGRGLRVLLQPINDYITIGDNAYMSKEDARRLFSNLRESYFKSGINSRLDRVVVHKNTFFTDKEISGITQALDGIPNVELVQIQEDTLWRGIRWNCHKVEGIWKNVDPSAPYHNWPTPRGSAVQLEEHTALLWTDGSVVHSELRNPRFTYYQSSRGIPSPLLVRRWYGSDPVETVLGDILKLTKMNWNSGQMFKRLPVTIEFASTLSKMAKQSEGLLNGEFYDFRYFI